MKKYKSNYCRKLQKCTLFSYSISFVTKNERTKIIKTLLRKAKNNGNEPLEMINAKCKHMFHRDVYDDDYV